MKICIVGLGYIGLPTALLFANKGHKVIGYDIKNTLIDKITTGTLPFSEPKLLQLYKKVIQSNTFHVSKSLEQANVYLIAVPTPLDKNSKSADLSSVKDAAKNIALVLKQGDLVILESTVSPGACKNILIPLLESSGYVAGTDFFVSHCPERAIPGNTIYEMIHNDRIIGSNDKKSGQMTQQLYSSFVKGKFYQTTLSTAEIVKLMENTYRDINIALANEFAQIADDCQINIWEAIKLANNHPRVNILKPGPGVGGHCISIDPWFLTGISSQRRIISLAREINDSMPNYVFQIVKKVVSDLVSPTITVLGVAYKGGVDDTRETPALKFIKLVENEGYNVKVHDPHVKEFEYEILGLEEAVKDSDCIVVLTDHLEFLEFNPKKISVLMRNKNVVDSRNILKEKKWKESGFRVKVLGDGRN